MEIVEQEWPAGSLQGALDWERIQKRFARVMG